MYSNKIGTHVCIKVATKTITKQYNRAKTALRKQILIKIYVNMLKIN